MAKTKLKIDVRNSGKGAGVVIKRLPEGLHKIYAKKVLKTKKMLEKKGETVYGKTSIEKEILKDLCELNGIEYPN